MSAAHSVVSGSPADPLVHIHRLLVSIPVEIDIKVHESTLRKFGLKDFGCLKETET